MFPAVTENVWVAVVSLRSVAVTVTVAVPAAVAVRESISADILTVAAAVLEAVAEYVKVSAAPSASLK